MFVCGKVKQMFKRETNDCVKVRQVFLLMKMRQMKDFLHEEDTVVFMCVGETGIFVFENVTDVCLCEKDVSMCEGEMHFCSLK